MFFLVTCGIAPLAFVGFFFAFVCGPLMCPCLRKNDRAMCRRFYSKMAILRKSSLVKLCQAKGGLSCSDVIF